MLENSSVLFPGLNVCTQFATWERVSMSWISYHNTQEPGFFAKPYSATLMVHRLFVRTCTCILNFCDLASLAFIVDMLMENLISDSGMIIILAMINKDIGIIWCLSH